MSSKINFSSDYNFENHPFSINTGKTRSFNVVEINEILKNYNYQKILSVKEYYKNFLKAIGFDNSIVVKNILSKKMKKDYLSYLKSSMEKYDMFLCEYFKDTFPVRSKLLKNIKPLFLNGDKLEIPEYQHNTKTGRSRIVSGTNYLTMKKEKRKLLKSSQSRTLYEIDFSSCEPMFYFNFLGFEINNFDLYEQIKRELAIDIDRSKLKLTIISILYGAGYETVKRSARISKIEYNKIKDYMHIEKFLSKIVKKENIVYNFYGRPLLNTNNKNIINHWVQSSVADYVYMSFYKYSKTIDTFMIHAVIHDAMLFSVSDHDVRKVENTKNLCELISNFKIPVKVHKIIDN